MRLRFVSAAVLLFASAAARADDVFNFSYTFANSDVLTANLTGTFLADGNTFNVSGLNSVAYNGVLQSAQSFILESYSSFGGRSDGTYAGGVLTLDGSYENFIEESSDGGFDLIVNAGFTYNNGSNIGVFGFSTLNDQAFVASNFVTSAEPEIAATPEPSSLALLGTGVLGVAGVIRRRLLPGDPEVMA